MTIAHLLHVFYIEYVLMPKNTLCSESRLKTINNEHDCEDATIDIATKDSFVVKTFHDHPTGCYIETYKGDTYGHFNRNDNGTRHKYSAPICKSISGK